MYDTAGTDLLAEHAEIRQVETVEDQDLGGVHALFARYPHPVTGDAIARARNLLAIVVSGRGVDHVDIDAATRAGVAVANNPGLGGRPVAEHTIGLMLSLARDLVAVTRDGMDATWKNRLEVRRIELAGRTLGIVGCGNVGGHVARIASSGLGMRVLAYDPYKSAEELATHGAAKVELLTDLLAASDFVTLHPELNDETRGMINERTLAAMRPEAFLVNASRGKVVDTAALERALRSGRLAGAALDVYETEPPPAGMPPADVPGLMLTAHIADMTEETRRALALSAARQLLAAVAGEPPQHLLNPQVSAEFHRRHQRAFMSA